MVPPLGQVAPTPFSRAGAGGGAAAVKLLPRTPGTALKTPARRVAVETNESEARAMDEWVSQNLLVPAGETGADAGDRRSSCSGGLGAPRVKVLVASTSSRPSALDDVLATSLSRTKRLLTAPPDAYMREMYLVGRMVAEGAALDVRQVEHVVQQTEGLTLGALSAVMDAAVEAARSKGADITASGMAAALQHVQSKRAAVYWKPDGKRFVGTADGNKRPSDPASLIPYLCSDCTVKLVSGRTYQLRISSSQALRVGPGGRCCVREPDTAGRLVEIPLLPPDAVGSPAVGGGGPQLAAGLPPVGAPLEGGLPLSWRDSGSDAGRTSYTAELTCSLPPTPAGRRQYLVVSAHVEDFGWVECPVQIKVYSRTDKNARGSFTLRFIQYDFRSDSSGSGALFAVNVHRL
ncbi:hypothetical protein GPECTOR_1g897 [Gonium pectorale]|uniref:Uncharacterized protein n=1 Tax=Gonium pectorale TaxID=33097 RepID=A0A150H4L6_GONPE|nr:hypothetical protein GPECTOR_1g897 [Gonium pectorale]|eukprot:KXZ56992.1 hypothetical protein GPECTOR_1g897 [Gonium pectorale]